MPTLNFTYMHGTFVQEPTRLNPHLPPIRMTGAKVVACIRYLFCPGMHQGVIYFHILYLQVWRVNMLFFHMPLLLSCSIVSVIVDCYLAIRHLEVESKHKVYTYWNFTFNAEKAKTNKKSFVYFGREFFYQTKMYLKLAILFSDQWCHIQMYRMIHFLIQNV